MISVESTWNNQEMKAIWSYLLVLVFLFITQTCTAKQDVCPPWFIPDNSSSTGCSCRSSEEVICGTDFPSVLFGFCMTYNSATETTELGPCPYIAQYSATLDFYIELPDNVSLLNEFMCGPLNREDKFCRKYGKEYLTVYVTVTS